MEKKVLEKATAKREIEENKHGEERFFTNSSKKSPANRYATTMARNKHTSKAKRAGFFPYALES